MRRLILVLLLTGCSSMPIQVQSPFVMPETEKVIYHPELPDPIPPFMKGRIKSLQYTDESGVVRTQLGFSADDSQLFRIWEEQRLLRSRKQEKIICYYRKELKAPHAKQCDKHYPKEGQ